MALGRFLRDSALYGAANLVARGMVFLLLPLYTQVLSQGEVGAFEWLSAASLTLLALLPLEVTQALARLRTQDFPEEDIQRQSRTAFSFTLLMLCGFALLMTLLSGSLNLEPVSRMSPDLPIAAAVLLLVNGWLYFVQNELRWGAHADRYALTSIVAAVVTVFTAVLMLVVMKAGILGLYFAMILGSACGAALAMRNLPYLLQFRLNLAELAPLLRFSIPLAISSAAIILATTVDRLLVARHLNLEALGVYGVAMRVAAIATLAFQGFQLAVLPATVGQGQYGQREAQLERSFRVFLLIAISLALILSALSPWLLTLLAAPAYRSGQACVPVLLVGTVAGAAYPFAPGLWLTGRSCAMAGLGLVLVVVGLALSSWLIPWIGVMGAALAYSATGLVYVSLMFWASDRVYPVRRSYPRLGFSVILFLLAATWQAWAAVHDWAVGWRLPAAALTLVPLTWLLITSQERQRCIRWIWTLRCRLLL
jgi:O-antigen/teichoic acid export membrane protein